MPTLTLEGIEFGNPSLIAAIHYWDQSIENSMSSLPLGCDFVTSLISLGGATINCFLDWAPPAGFCEWLLEDSAWRYLLCPLLGGDSWYGSWVVDLPVFGTFRGGLGASQVFVPGPCSRGQVGYMVLFWRFFKQPHESCLYLGQNLPKFLVSKVWGKHSVICTVEIGYGVWG